MPRHDQPALFQHLQRVAQDWPRHVELARQLALGRQPVGDPQHAFEDQGLDLLHDLVGGAHMLDPGKNCAQNDAEGSTMRAHIRGKRDNWSNKLSNWTTSRPALGRIEIVRRSG